MKNILTNAYFIGIVCSLVVALFFFLLDRHKRIEKKKSEFLLNLEKSKLKVKKDVTIGDHNKNSDSNIIRSHKANISDDSEMEIGGDLIIGDKFKK